MESYYNTTGKIIYLVMLVLLLVGMGCSLGLTSNIGKDKEAKKHYGTAVCSTLFVSLYVVYSLLKDSKLLPMLNE
jgi:hypothetical protein